MQRRSLAPVARHLPELMFKSAALLWPPNTVVLARNSVALSQGMPWHDALARGAPGALEQALDDALSWLVRSQDRIGSGGVGCDELYRWTRGYPEVTGYIIPTMFDAAAELRRPGVGRARGAHGGVGAPDPAIRRRLGRRVRGRRPAIDGVQHRTGDPRSSSCFGGDRRPALPRCGGACRTLDRLHSGARRQLGRRELQRDATRLRHVCGCAARAPCARDRRRHLHRGRATELRVRAHTAAKRTGGSRTPTTAPTSPMPP